MPEDQEQVYHQEETPTRYVVFLTYEAILSWGQVVTETTDELIVRLGYKIGKNHGIYKKPDKNRSITNGQVIGSYASVDDAYTSYQGLIDLDETSPLSEKALGAYLSERVEGFRNQIVVDTARRIRSGSFSLTDDGLEPSYQEEEVVEPPFLLQHISDKMPVPNWLVILSGGAIGAAIGTYADEAYSSVPEWGTVHALSFILLCGLAGAWLAHFAIRKWDL